MKLLIFSRATTKQECLVNTRKNVLYWFLLSVCAVIFSGLIYQYVGLKMLIRRSAHIETTVGYFFPFGVARWWDGYVAGVIWSLVFALFFIREGKKRDVDIDEDDLIQNLTKTCLMTTGIYTLVMAYLFFLGFTNTTGWLDSTLDILLGPPIALVVAFFLSFTFFFALSFIIALSLLAVFGLGPMVVDFFNKDSAQKQT